MDAAKSSSKSSKKASKGLFSKAKGLIRSNKALDESDTTGDTESLWKSESELGFDPAQNSPVTPASLPDNKRLSKQRKSASRKATLLSPPRSPGSLAGQKVRRSSIGVVAGPPLEGQKEMDSVNNGTEIAIVSPTKKKSKRRKSLGAVNETKEKVRATRESGRKAGKRSNSQPRISTKGLTGRNASVRNTGEGVNDLMAHIAPPTESEAELKDDDLVSPSGKARTTVDRDGKIRRVSSKKQLEDCLSEGEGDETMSKKSSKSRQSAKGGAPRKKKSRDGTEGKKRRKHAPGIDEGSAYSEKTKGSKKKSAKDSDDHSAHSEKSENRRTKKKISKRDVMEWGNSSDSSLRSDRSEKKLKKKNSKRDVLDLSNHSKKRENSKRDLLDISDHSGKSEKAKRASSDRRGGRRDGLSPLISPNRPKSKSVPDLVSHAVLPFSESSDLKGAESLTPPTSDLSLGKVGMLVGASPGANGHLDKDQDKLVARIEELSLEKESLNTELTKLRKELRDVKLESQRSHTTGRELRADLREREFIIKESDMRIEALEKAVESQLDKMEDMEEELRRANEEVFILEEKLSHMEAVLTESAAVEGGGAKKEAEMAHNRQQRLERRLEEKEKELAERENALKEERRLLLTDGQSTRSVAQLEQDNRMLLKAMNREKAEAEEKLQLKDAEIAALRTDLQRTENGDAPGGGDGSMSILLKKDDQISLLERELEKLKKSLEDRGMGDFDKANRELQAAKNEGQAMKSKYEGAQRRNLILEDEIDHWKSVNCNLEDELAEQKAQANNWRMKYEDVVEPGDDDDDGRGMGMGGRLPGSGMSAAEMAMSRNGDESDEDDRTINTISGLWSKLTTPQSKKSTVGGTLPSGSLKDVIARSTFH
eukprot:CAMPEP_0117018040 /NCGR_PEP_ID=MMETSP0472-20121206/13991_1 /TAXON_ID=693140 ORGANISM="Tiarina fusus, Strain LIS" /NCGR_SAMPLE_ID=MMETSP0472 /ASSEMBLY_ACC=CAM_ASM_000603 /LENGTH=879 /DNA_ID=CAMNT_0004722553 /DNA_START=187 /DNA_END=2826 /DNA_ORIENTATION=+